MTPEQLIRAQAPHDARLFALVPWTKRPRSEHAHLDAVDRESFLALWVSGNYGIALDGQYLLVDKDRDDEVVQAFEARLPETWMQTTWKRGTHRLYRVPRGFVGRNGRWPGGELKVNGYLVGPGSSVHADGLVGTYEIISSADPVEAPDWLLDMVRADAPRATLTSAADIDVMLDGTRDNELASIGGFMRHKGYSETFICAALAGIVDSGVVEQTPGREIRSVDIERIAHSVARYTPGPGDVRIGAADWICGSNVAIVGPPVDWWVRGFLPHNELIGIFGGKGVGKSSFASWIATQVTKAGGSFLFVGVEEPFPRFLGRSVLCGGDRSRIFSYGQASQLMLPKAVPELREAVRTAGTSFVYFDSIYTHFERIQGENMAERARRCLGPLAEMAQDTGCTIATVFHERRDGDYLGSTEMINVGRVTLHAERAENQPLVVSVHTTNLWEPAFELTFYAEEKALRDPDTDEIQYERVDGELVPMTVRVPTRGPDRKKGIRAGNVADFEDTDDEP